MTDAPRSLSQSLTRPLLLACLVVLVFGTLLAGRIVQNEYDELFDAMLKAKADLLFSLVVKQDAFGTFDDPLGRIEGPGLPASEKAAFWLLDSGGGVVHRSGFQPDALNRPDPQSRAFQTSGSYRFFLTGAGPQGLRLQVAEPLFERNQAVREVVMGLAFSLAMLALVVFALVRRSITSVQRSVRDLGEVIGRKGEADLSPIDPAMGFVELRPAVTKLNDLMLRLSRAVAAERSFATNAAHELRTPLAISLAHTQRLKATSVEAHVSAKADEIEQGLKKLIHLVERLLQFSRAQSGLGTTGVATDAAPVIAMVFDEALRRKPGPVRILCKAPAGPVMTSMDPDALAIVLLNLIDNAVKYSVGDGPVVLDAEIPGQITLSNDCAPLDRADIEQIRTRFVRKSSAIDGYGVGLSIVHMLCDQSGARIEITSPRPEDTRGVAVRLQLPA